MYQYSTDLVFPIAATAIGGLLLWVIIYLIKLVVSQEKETGKLKTEITILEEKVISLNNKINTELMQLEVSVSDLKNEISKGAEEKLKLHQLVEERLMTFRNGLDEKLDKMFAKVNRISEDVAVIKSKQSK